MRVGFVAQGVDEVLAVQKERKKPLSYIVGKTYLWPWAHARTGVASWKLMWCGQPHLRFEGDVEEILIFEPSDY